MRGRDDSGDPLPRAYVLINCDLGTEKSLVSELQKIDSISEVHGTLGMYDIILKIESDGDDINSTVTDKIRRMEKINSTMTLTRLEDEEIFIPGPDRPAGPMPGQNTSQAYVVIHCDQGQEYPILRKLGKIPEVKEGDAVFGFYDVICKVEASGHNELEKIITKGIRGLDHIRTTMTLNVITEQE